MVGDRGSFFVVWCTKIYDGDVVEMLALQDGSPVGRTGALLVLSCLLTMQSQPLRIFDCGWYRMRLWMVVCISI